MSLQHVDIIIVGGGLVGAGLALALEPSNLKIALVDARLPSANDPRLFAMNYSSCQFLTNLGLWSSLHAHAAAINQVHVSAKGRFGAVRLNKEETQLPFLGHVIPARYIEEAINNAINACAAKNNNLTVFRPATVHAIEQDHEHAIVSLSLDQQTIKLTANVVIGADGTISTVREQAGIETKTVDYEQSALVTRTTLQRDHAHIAYERFNNHGAIAMLPLTNNECATIWSADNDYIHSLSTLSDADFLATLQQEFGYRLGRFQRISTRHYFPLKMVKAKNNWRNHVLLIGNAAHTLHPIAAQGFNLALYEVAVLCDYIFADKIVTAENLANALHNAAKQEAASMKVSHYLSELFLEKSTITSIATQVGMAGLDTILPLKKKFIERMTGRAGRVPRLLLRAID